MQELPITIEEVVSCDEYTGKRGKGFSFYCAVIDDNDEKHLVKINAKSARRWKEGDAAIITAQDYDPWELDGEEYQPVTADKPEGDRGGRQATGSGKTKRTGGNANRAPAGLTYTDYCQAEEAFLPDAINTMTEIIKASGIADDVGADAALQTFVDGTLRLLATRLIAFGDGKMQFRSGD